MLKTKILKTKILNPIFVAFYTQNSFVRARPSETIEFSGFSAAPPIDNPSNYAYNNE